MKRILVSILLLVTVLLISKPFSAELNNFPKPAKAVADYSYSQANTFDQKQPNPLQSSVVGCPCDISSPNPTISLVLIAAVAAWLAMACFIYGSYFIAALVWG